MLDLGRDVLETFAEVYRPEPHWADEGLTLHAAHVGTSAFAKRAWAKKNRDKMNEHRRMMRKVNPEYGR